MARGVMKRLGMQSLDLAVLEMVTGGAALAQTPPKDTPGGSVTTAMRTRTAFATGTNPDAVADAVEDVGMAAEGAGGRARRVQQHGVEGARVGPRPGVGGHEPRFCSLSSLAGSVRCGSA